jgi:hypothetical protein
VIRKRRDGLQVQVYAGRDPLTGRKRYVSQQVAGQTKASMRQAKQIEAWLLEEVDAGRHTGSRSRTMAELLERWLDAPLAVPAWVGSDRCWKAGGSDRHRPSEQVVRYRLNRGGDRQLNRALHTIVMIREAWHEPTKRYVARHTAQGKSPREVRRCLTRAVARGLYRLLERQAAPSPA